MREKGSAVFRLYSKSCEYAIRALMCAAPDGSPRRFQAKDVCQRSGIPEPYTRKVLQSLVQAGFLRAVLGPGGGYEMTCDPAEITLYEIIRAVDGEDTFDACILGLPECGGKNPCPLHEVWANTKERLFMQMHSKTLKNLILQSASEEKQAGPRRRVQKREKGRDEGKRE